MSISEKPPCRCKERRTAMVNAAVALSKGDMETWKRETEFVRQTAVEDLQLYRKWRDENKAAAEVLDRESVAAPPSPAPQSERQAEVRKMLTTPAIDHIRARQVLTRQDNK